MELNLLEWNGNGCKFSSASAFFAARICNLHLIFVSIPSHIVDSFVIVSLFLLSLVIISQPFSTLLTLN